MIDTQLKKGLLEMCVLKYLSGDPSYGYEIMVGVAEHAAISESTLYAILHRLESQGMLSTYREEHDGRLRKYYEITRAGIIKLNEFKGENAKMQQILGYIIGGEDEV
ncbi:PadR family transcriptional regulator [Alphaproteobacteria bacterium]|nr:PadR family transcriptional regulator [Alphaproteobacteria bacterium]